MDDPLHTIDTQSVDLLNNKNKQAALSALESGKVVYFPNVSLTPLAEEQGLLSETVLAPNYKNISYNFCTQQISGMTDVQESLMKPFMHRFAQFSKELLDTLLPEYSKDVRWGRTSYRPAEIKGRKCSKRKDDTRVHVDSFPSTPVNGLRILRVFCNINPYGEPRVWHVGEPFSEVLTTFFARIPPYRKSLARLLKWIKATKTLRSSYDHHMLHLHDSMKLSDLYQANLKKRQIDFPPQSTWLVFTDYVSHAALGGQFLLEQTFYLPIEAMKNPELSPYKQWEKLGVM